MERLRHNLRYVVNALALAAAGLTLPQFGAVVRGAKKKKNKRTAPPRTGRRRRFDESLDRPPIHDRRVLT